MSDTKPKYRPVPESIANDTTFELDWNIYQRTGKVVCNCDRCKRRHADR